MLSAEVRRERNGDEAEPKAEAETRHRAETETRQNKIGRVPCDEREQAQTGTRWRSALLYRERATNE